jgi:hypothetical protein
VHGLLGHLEQVGFAGALRFLGIDGQGREILTYFEGFEQAMDLVGYYEVSNSLVSLWGRRTHADRLLHEGGEV